MQLARFRRPRRTLPRLSQAVSPKSTDRSTVNHPVAFRQSLGEAERACQNLRPVGKQRGERAAVGGLN